MRPLSTHLWAPVIALSGVLCQSALAQTPVPGQPFASALNQPLVLAPSQFSLLAQNQSAPVQNQTPPLAQSQSPAPAQTRVPALAQNENAGQGLRTPGNGRPPGATDARPNASPAPASSSRADDSTQPTEVTADSVQGVTDQDVTATGNADLKRGTLSIHADSLHYQSEGDEVTATGNVRIQHDGNTIEGPALHYRIPDSTGKFNQPSYSIVPTVRNPNTQPVAVRGAAKELDFEGEDKFKLEDATFTTCKPGDDSWYAEAGELNLDFTRQTGTVSQAFIYFHDKPIAWLPWMSFSLNNERKSGFLPPSIGSTGNGGPEFTIPYYFNLAPNRDLTLAARYMEKRGLQYSGQLRFLDRTNSGELSFEDLPNDKVIQQPRSAFTLNDAFASSNGKVTAQVNVNRVSDDDYFRDLATRINLTSQTNLVREAYATYSDTWWDTGSYSATARVQRFQTLQDPNNPIVPPYGRTPQLLLGASRQDFHGLDFNLASEYDQFTHPTMINGERISAYPSVSLPMISAGGYITPKFGVNATRYRLDSSLLAPGVNADPTRVLPIFSLDSGATFEREANFFGNAVVQTLEPRAYYLRVPYKDQSQIPIFDTAIADFNYAQIFSENTFVGGDRIADANQLTLALTSRLLTQSSGQELIRGTLGQRYYFQDQKVLLNPGDTPRTYGASDWLAALSGRIAPHWTADTGIEYDQRDQIAQRLTAGVRYQPAPFRTLNLSYRYLRDQLNQVDVSAQWPLGSSGWYGVGRYNYSFQDGRVVEALGGFEYNGDCWVGRFVVQRFATATGQATNTIFFQLELSEFSRLGSNPLESLKRNIPGYSRLNEPTTPPSSSNQAVDFFD